jgi:HAD superfamily hydrolase (TIGR01509 family)
VPIIARTTETVDSAVRGVILDMDGVVVDSEHLSELGWGAFAQQHGRTWTDADTRALQGMSTTEWARALAARIDRPGLVDEARRHCVDHYVGALERGEGPALAGARELVEEVSRRCPVALASSAPRRGIDAALRRDGLDRFFAATVSSEEVARGKPSPDVYLEAARRIGVDPAHAAGVEDPGNGLRAAAAAGLTVVALPNTAFPPPPDALALAAHVAADHRDVLRFLLARLPAR